MTGILQDVTVLELCQVTPCCMVGMQLGDLGARVIKIEGLPTTETYGLAMSPKEADPKVLAGSMLNRNKESISVDLKSDAGHEVLRRLIERSDVLIESFRPGVMARLGFSYPDAAILNPSLIYCSMSGYGQDGPYSVLGGHDLNYMGMSGILSVLPGHDDPKLTPLNLVSDLGGAAMHAVAGILAALLERSRSQLGQHIDISYTDTALALLASTSTYQDYARRGELPVPGAGAPWGGYPYYRTYKTKDSRKLTIGCLEPTLWKRLCDVMNCPELLDCGPKSSNRFSLPSVAHANACRVLEGRFLEQDRDYWFSLLAESGVGVGKVYELSELPSDPHLQHRKSFVDTSIAGDHSSHQVAPAIRLSRTPSSIRGSSPLLGQDTEEILMWLGYGDSQRTALTNSGALFAQDIQ